MEERPESCEVCCCEGGCEFDDRPEVESMGAGGHGLGVHPGLEELLCSDDGCGTRDEADACYRDEYSAAPPAERST